MHPAVASHPAIPSHPMVRFPPVVIVVESSFSPRVHIATTACPCGLSMYNYYLKHMCMCRLKQSRPKSKECDLKKLSLAMEKIFMLRGPDFRREAADWTGPRDKKKLRKKRDRNNRKKQERTTKTRSKCTECKCQARTPLHGWARGMCKTHAIENKLEIPQIKKKVKVKNELKKVKVKNEPIQRCLIAVKQEPQSDEEEATWRFELAQRPLRQSGAKEAKEAEDQELHCPWFKMCLDIGKRACEETDDVGEDPLLFTWEADEGSETEDEAEDEDKPWFDDITTMPEASLGLCCRHGHMHGVPWQRQGFTLSPPSVAEGDIIEPEAGEGHEEGHPNQEDTMFWQDSLPLPPVMEDLKNGSVEIPKIMKKGTSRKKDTSAAGRAWTGSWTGIIASSSGRALRKRVLETREPRMALDRDCKDCQS